MKGADVCLAISIFALIAVCIINNVARTSLTEDYDELLGQHNRLMEENGQLKQDKKNLEKANELCQRAINYALEVKLLTERHLDSFGPTDLTDDCLDILPPGGYHPPPEDIDIDGEARGGISWD